MRRCVLRCAAGIWRSRRPCPKGAAGARAVGLGRLSEARERRLGFDRAQVRLILSKGCGWIGLTLGHGRRRMPIRAGLSVSYTLLKAKPQVGYFWFFFVNFCCETI